MLACALMVPALAASPATVKPTPRKATEIFIPVGAGKLISLQELADMKPLEYATLSGKKMKFTDRVGFWLAQKKLRHSINADGTVNNENLAGMYRADGGGGGGFHLGGFALGFLLGLIGILIAYVIKDDKKRARRKWAWIGWLTFLVIYLVIVLA